MKMLNNREFTIYDAVTQDAPEKPGEYCFKRDVIFLLGFNTMRWFWRETKILKVFAENGG